MTSEFDAGATDMAGMRDSSDGNNTADMIAPGTDGLRKRRKQSFQKAKDKINARLSRIRNNSRVRKLPKHTSGSVWHQIMKAPVQIFNKQFSSRLNLIFLALELSWKYLLLGYFLFVFTLAAVLGGFFRAGECSLDYSFTRIYLLVVQQLMTGPAFLELSDRETGDLSSGCILIGFVTSTCTLFLQAFILSMAVRKFMKPKSAVAFSRKLCFNSRNAVPCLQTRAFNLRGNLISDVSIRAVYSYKRTTAEGETHYMVEDVEFKGPQWMKFPVTFTHYIDETSPLFKPYFTDRHIEGRLFMELVGYDHTLCEEVHASWVFTLPEDAALYCRFANMVVKTFQDAVEDGSYQCAVEMSSFDAVEPVPEAEAILSRLTQGVCPFTAQQCSQIDKNDFNAKGYSRLQSAVAELDTPTKGQPHTVDADNTANADNPNAGPADNGDADNGGADNDHVGTANAEGMGAPLPEESAAVLTTLYDDNAPTTAVSSSNDNSMLSPAGSHGAEAEPADLQASSDSRHGVLLQHASLHVEEA
eukprot:m.61271 g.61271  ORF g.61271 m.61271 type:complete len:529 (+) comp13869_c0_seq1:186-1772(+)